ncbi:hypothetical protein [Yinghuangia soli]|uniref:Uncharacterized protein n=1 Tax=Yinghuangia soli TaxID=2908204 RepID=A0AA41Q2D6_9ACTN|nr:hypothetical protein [Yinghuangia soli]MCF2529476.1 hypothetical protein [Yinghuangia soli]
MAEQDGRTPDGEQGTGPGSGPGSTGDPEGPRWGSSRARLGLIVGGLSLAIVIATLAFAVERNLGGSDDPKAAPSPTPTPTAPPSAAPTATGNIRIPQASAPSGAVRPTATTPATPPSGLTTSRPPGVDKAAAAAPITPRQAFRDEKVVVPSGGIYERVLMYTPADCREMMSRELAAVIEQGRGCAQLTGALYTDAARGLQITVSVLSMKDVNDAAAAFGLAVLDPVRYQIAALDPRPGAGVAAPPDGSPGAFARIMTVRSVVFASAQWSDGRNEASEKLTVPMTELLAYVNARVASYELSTART